MVLLVDTEVKWSPKRFAGLILESLAEKFRFSRISLGDVNHLVLGEANDPHIRAGRDDDALHEAELAVEGDTLWRRSGLPFLSNFEIAWPP